MPSPSDVSTRYFQPASSAVALPLKPTRSTEAAVVASIRSHATPRFPASGTASEDRPEGQEGSVVEACSALGSARARSSTNGGRPVTSARLRDRRARRSRR